MSPPNFKELNESIYDALEAIRRRPAMYVPEKSIKQLRAFLDGYIGGLGRLRHALRDQGDLRRFNEWIARRLGFHEPTPGWCNMIREKSLNDEDAFNRFFELLDEFRREPK